MHVKGGLKVSLEYSATLIFLSRQNVCYKVVPIEEPVVPENVQDLKDGGVIITSLRGDRGDVLSHRGGRGSLASLFVLRGNIRKNQLFLLHLIPLILEVRKE